MVDRGAFGADPARVRFTDNCFVRAAPHRRGAVLGVMRQGEALPCDGKPASGWLPVSYRGLSGWVSAKFARPER